MKKTLKGAGAILALVTTSIACSSTPVEEEEATSAAPITLAGITLTANQAKWLSAIESAVPSLPGSAEERAHRAAIVAWWSLKEGVLSLPNPYLHNLCEQGGKNVSIGHTAQCYSTWQVGISGIQVPNVTDAQVADMAARVHPTMSTDALLADIATKAGVAVSTVKGTTGRVRSGWLLRDPAVGIALQWPFADDCANGGPSWCYGNWSEAQAFASSASRIQAVIGALEQRFLAAKASTSTPTGADAPAAETDLCTNATLGDGLYCATWFGAGNDPKVLLECRGKKTATRTVCPGACERMPDGYNDRCGAGSASPSPGGTGSEGLSAARAAMMDRAQQWVTANMPYCGGVPGGADAICGGTCTGRPRKAEWDVYRSDCSGFVSWVWQLAYQDGHRTWGFAPFNQEGPAFSERIAANDLKPGDALNSTTKDIYSQHIILFAGWVDRTNGIIKTREEANCSADLVVDDNRKMVVNGDGSVSLGGKTYWPIRKLGVQ